MDQSMCSALATAEPFTIYHLTRESSSVSFKTQGLQHTEEKMLLKDALRYFQQGVYVLQQTFSGRESI